MSTSVTTTKPRKLGCNSLGFRGRQGERASATTVQAGQMGLRERDRERLGGEGQGERVIAESFFLGEEMRDSCARPPRL